MWCKSGGYAYLEGSKEATGPALPLHQAKAQPRLTTEEEALLPGRPGQLAAGPCLAKQQLPHLVHLYATTLRITTVTALPNRMCMDWPLVMSCSVFWPCFILS